MTADGGRFRIAISGSYGGLNLGDEAILASIAKQLRDSIPVQITVFSRNPEDTVQRHDVDRAVPVFSMTREEARAEVENCDLLILGGGGILYDEAVERYLREVTLAHQAHVPVVVYAVGAGPLKDPSNRKLVSDALSGTAVITARDRQACKLLEEIGIEQNIELTADPALLLEPEDLPPDALKREALDEQHRLVGISVREPGPAAPDIDVEHYHALLANTADFMVERFDAGVVFVPMERMQMDVQQSHAVVARMYHAQRATVLKGEYTSRQLISLIGHFQFVLGMRLHFLIFAALKGVPFVALPYASKVAGFLEDLQLPAPPLKEVTTGRLIAHVDWSWDMQQDLRNRIAARLPMLQERARRTNTLVLETLNGIRLEGRKAG